MCNGRSGGIQLADTFRLKTSETLRGRSVFLHSAIQRHTPPCIYTDVHANTNLTQFLPDFHVFAPQNVSFRAISHLTKRLCVAKC